MTDGDSGGRKTSPAENVRLKWKSFTMFGNPCLKATYEIDSYKRKLKSTEAFGSCIQGAAALHI